MNFYKRERIALFIDGTNLYVTAKAASLDIDYKLLLDIFKAQGYFIRATYYTALLDDQEFSPIRPLIDWLDYNGYTIKTKPAKEYTDSQGRKKIKGNMNIELTIDVLEMLDNIDHIVLFSGDGDFKALLEAVQRRGKKISIVSTLVTQPPMASDELRRQADMFIELSDIQGEICREYLKMLRENNAIDFHDILREDEK